MWDLLSRGGEGADEKVEGKKDAKNPLSICCYLLILPASHEAITLCFYFDNPPRTTTTPGTLSSPSTSTLTAMLPE